MTGDGCGDSKSQTGWNITSPKGGADMASFTLTNVSQAREMMEQAQKKVERAQTTLEKFKDRAEEAMATGLKIAEIGMTTTAFGYVNGRWGENGELAVMGMPVDLGTAVAMHTVAFLGGFGKYSEHGHNIGTGALAACGYRTAAAMGAKAAAEAKAHATGAPAFSGVLPWMLPQPVAAPQPQPQPLAQAPQNYVPQNYVPSAYVPTSH